MFNVCTIITPDYLHKALALLYSMTPFRAIRMHCLVSEEWRNLEDFEESMSVGDSQIIFYALDDIYDQQKLQELPRNNDRLRWASKSRFLIYLFETENISSLIYLDNDVCFFNDFRFLFDELQNHTLLLTPHWRPLDPQANEMQFSCNFRDGLYNAGFLGASEQSLEALNWWHQACLYKCEFDFQNGFYVDQRYLDAFPVYFKGVKIMNHLGCNVAQWNADFLERKDIDGEILINSKWPIVFVHFSPVTIENIENGNDGKLKPYLHKHISYIDRAKKEIQALTIGLKSI